jgi:phosphoglycolate phosphatase
LTARFAGIRLVAFDLDGTLVDSAPDLCHCLGEALASVGLSRPTEDETRSWIGDGVEALVERGLEHKAAQAEAARGGAVERGDDAEPPAMERDAEPGGASPRNRETGSLSGSALPFDAAYGEFLRCYAQSLFVRTKLYPGVVDTLDALRNRGLRLCCITNKRVKFSLEVLERAGIRDRFELVLGGDSLHEKKPSPAQLLAAAETFGIDSSMQGRACMLVGDSVNDYSVARAAGWAFAWAAYGYAPRVPGEHDERTGVPTEVARIDSIVDLKTLLRIDPRAS